MCKRICLLSQNYFAFFEDIRKPFVISPHTFLSPSFRPGFVLGSDYRQSICSPPGAVVRTIEKAHKGEITSLTLTTNGHKIISGSYDFTVGVWDVESGFLMPHNARVGPLLHQAEFFLDPWGGESHMVKGILETFGRILAQKGLGALKWKIFCPFLGYNQTGTNPLHGGGVTGSFSILRLVASGGFLPLQGGGGESGPTLTLS